MNRRADRIAIAAVEAIGIILLIVTGMVVGAAALLGVVGVIAFVVLAIAGAIGGVR